MENLLKISTGNNKLSTRNILDLPSGLSCPGALQCKAWVDRIEGKNKIVDGDEMLFRCYAASQEVRHNTVYEARRYNFNLIKKALREGNAVELIDKSLDQNLRLTRFHSSGDFFSLDYLRACIRVAELNPKNDFYFYSKSLNFFLDIGLPENMFLTASYGGKFDELIHKGYFNRVAYVVNTEEEAKLKGLEIDHDDSHCFKDKDFALLVHGTQAKGSEAGKAIAERRRKGEFTGYRKKV